MPLVISKVVFLVCIKSALIMSLPARTINKIPLNSCVCWMKIYFNLNYQGMKKFSEETCDFQILGNEALMIAGY